MKKFFRWLGFVAVGLVASWFSPSPTSTLHSSARCARQYMVAETLSVSLPTDAGEIEEGHRLAQHHGMHALPRSQSRWRAAHRDSAASRVSCRRTSRTTIPEMSDAQLSGLLRRGVKRDGTGVWLMPSEMFRHLHDADLARIIAWVRTVPPGEGVTGKSRFHLMGRVRRRARQDQVRRPADRGSCRRSSDSAGTRRLPRHECVQRMPRPGSQGHTR